MLIQEVLTDLEPQAVIDQARAFFLTRFSTYAAFEQDEGPHHIRFVVEAGELLIGTVPQNDQTLVRGSTSRMHHELSQFLATLAEAEDVRQNAVGPGASGAG